MKKITLISAALLLLAAGCSKNKVEVIDESQPQEEAWVNDLTLPVPIQFSTPGINTETKAVTNGPIEGTIMNNLDIGIYALAVGDGDKGNNSPNVNPQTWKFSDAESILLGNEKVTTGENGEIVLEGKYYPVTSDYSYSFYSYYPYNESIAKVTEGERNSFRTTYTNIGYTDILFARADATKLQMYQDNIGYNAAYIRLLKSTGNERFMPELKFEHLLTSLQITAKIAIEEGSSNIRIQNVALTGANTTVYLYIADNYDNDSSAANDRTGTIVPTGATGKIILTDGTDTDFTDVELGAEAKVLSQFLVVPGAGYQMEVTYGIWNNGELTQIVTKSKSVTSSSGSFEKGNRYNVNITISDALVFDIKSELTAWDDKTDDVDLPTM